MPTDRARVEDELNKARSRLLDLTKANRLLKLRETRTGTLKIIDEIPDQIYEELVLNEKSMDFLPLQVSTRIGGPQESAPQDPEWLNSGTLERTMEEDSQEWELPPHTDRHTDLSLQTSLKPGELQKRLFYIHKQARSMLEEQGYTILYLALGFLKFEWPGGDDQEAETIQAPLVLVPVELDRSRVDLSFNLKWTQEEIISNISLKAKLTEQGVSLPDFEMPEERGGIDRYFQLVRETISREPGWEVLQNDIYLSFFSFAKFIMHKDLDVRSWPNDKSPIDHPLIRSILAPSEQEPADSGFSEEEIDTRLRTQDLFHILDADPSQIAVIEDAKAKRNLVVEGPPGTGKSQTITNIIAEFLAAGKSILFVSEKMAALEVVKDRLDQTGLGDFCLELHSRKANKKRVLEKLRRSMEASSAQPVNFEQEFFRLETLKANLNSYASALREPFGQLGETIYSLFTIREKTRRYFEALRRPMPRISFHDPKNCDRSLWTTGRQTLSDLKDLLDLVKPLASNPWRGTRPPLVLPTDQEEIGTLIKNSKEATDQIIRFCEDLTRLCGIIHPRTLGDLKNVQTAAKVMIKSRPSEQEVLLNPEWNQPSERADGLIKMVEAFQVQRHRSLQKFHPTVLEQDLIATIEDFQSFKNRWFRIFYRRYRDLKREIFKIYKIRPPRKFLEKLSDLEELKTLRGILGRIHHEKETGKGLFGSHWKGESSDPEQLKRFSAWIVSFRSQLLQKVLTNTAVELASSGVNHGKVESALRELEQAQNQLVVHRGHLADKLKINFPSTFGSDSEELPLQIWRAKLDTWEESLPSLQRWSQFIARCEECLRTIASPLVKDIELDMLETKDVIPCFEGAFADDLLRLAFGERPELANFVGELHERKIEEFAELDRKLIQLNRKRLRHKVGLMRPQITGGVSHSSEVGILLGELNRKRGHMPIRKLLTLAGGVIKKYKPCFMMSPLSIAQFLSPGQINFDAILFDEASQVRPEDALGASLRGSQIIVMGDTRQLPPTTFFDRILKDSGEEDPEEQPSASVADVESILHQCKRSFPTKTLRWHYRSKHESLIAVSNQEFYNNCLLIYPSPHKRSDRLGLEHVHLPNATYDRGRSATNRGEARVVAEAVMRHYEMFPSKSLGVGAFSQKQEIAIEAEVEKQRNANRGMEEFFRRERAEHFFIKNLETIQGDERDVIFLSIGYGFDSEGGEVKQTFGPLTNNGGERRLNVLISRAKERCVVFSNFRARDLKVKPETSFGMRALKVFLEYAETGKLTETHQVGGDTESPFEDSVCNFLRERGFEVQTQVGCGGFRVDLAVVNPKAHGEYLLGIECDGAKYHSSRVARDRDRLREQILRGKGWHIHRVWSTDWYRKPQESENKLLKAIALRQSQSFEPEGIQPVERPIQKNSDKEKDDSGSVGIPSPSIESATSEVEILYKKCSSLELNENANVSDPLILKGPVIKIVNTEGPVHHQIVAKRLKSLCRGGRVPVEAIKKAIDAAKRTGRIYGRGDFLWPNYAKPLEVRKRMDPAESKAEFICDEELEESVKSQLKGQGSINQKPLIKKVFLQLGVDLNENSDFDQIYSVIQKMVQAGQIISDPNGNVSLKER
ncbi:MAG: DUF4011 domain-containing protein [Nitrospinae bacterium]|nr:DUF4011 domain-containing protein [Nitrospinota bacterium]